MMLLKKHNLRLKERGIPYQAVLPYRSGSNPVNDYICDKGHSFIADRARVMAKKSKCPSCTPNMTLNHEAYENRLLEIEAPLYPVEPYKGIHTKIKHKCVEGHEHFIVPSTVLNGLKNCPHCSGMAKKTTESYKAELIKKGIKYIPLEEYITVMTKIKHQCYWCDHVWNVLPHEILKGSGCPICASMGFNRGKPAILYYAKLWDEHRTYYKIGITNKTPQERLKNCGKHYRILLERQYDTGREAEAAEQMILEEYKESKALAPKWLKTGGNTELFKHDILLLDDAK